MALSRVAFAATAGNVSTAQSTASFTWLTGDLFVAIQGDESGGLGGKPLTPTFGGGTFTSLVAATGDDSSHCYGRAWSCTVAAGSSGAVSVADSTPDTHHHVLLVWQFRGHNGVGVSGGLADTTLVRSLANVGSNNWVVMGMFDWTASAAGKTGSPTVTNEVVDLLDGTRYSYWGGDWSGQSGTVSYGIASGAGTWTKINVSVQEAAAGGAVRPYQRRDPVRQSIKRASFY